LEKVKERCSRLLLDEPLSALDTKSRRRLQAELALLHRKWQIPFILVTHDMNEANTLGDCIIRLEKGRVKGYDCM